MHPKPGTSKVESPGPKIEFKTSDESAEKKF
jgi:hypothetical protein